MKYSNTMNDIYDTINDYNPNRSHNILIVFENMIADMNTNESFQSIVQELFIRCQKLNIPLVLITQSYLCQKTSD